MPMNQKSSKKQYGSAGGGPRKAMSSGGSSGGDYTASGGSAMGSVGYSGSLKNSVTDNTGAAGSASIRKGKTGYSPSKSGTQPARG